MTYAYFRVILKQSGKVTVYMVRSDKMNQFFKSNCVGLMPTSITIKGRYYERTDVPRKWYAVVPTEKDVLA